MVRDKIKFFMFVAIAVLSLAFVAGMVSARVEFQNINLNPRPAQAGDSVSLTFKIKNLGSAGGTTQLLSEISIAPIQLTGCSSSITSQTDISGVPSNLDLNEASGTITALFNIPTGQTPCTYEGRITGTGRYAATTNFESDPITLEVRGASSITISAIRQLTQSQDGVIEIRNNGNTRLENIVLSTPTTNFIIGFSENNFNLNAGTTKRVTITSDDLGNVGFGGRSFVIRAEASDGTRGDITMNVQGSFCKFGERGGNLSISDVDIDNQGEGDDDEWKLLDVVEIQVEVENNGDDDIDDVIVELGLFDSDGKNQIGDLDFENDGDEEIELGDLKDGDDDTVTFRFRVPADMADGTYKLTVKAYSDDLGESNECTNTASELSNDDLYESIDIERESDEGKFIAFDNIALLPSEATCGESVTMTLDVFNIGDEEQDQVRVILRNSELSIDEFIEIRKDMEEGDKERISFDFVIPKNIVSKIYQLRLSAEYDYSRGNYRESSDDDTLFSIRVLSCGEQTPGGGAPITGRIAAINAELDSDARAGEELAVSVTITNLKSTRTVFNVNALDFRSWSSLKDISERIIDLGPGESKNVLFRFDVDDDAEGEESFIVEVLSDSVTETREIAVNIEGAGSSRGFRFNLGDNAYLWIIGIVNVVLVILIIIVAVRISRR